MTLEDQLRQLFLAHVECVRLADDPAGRAIRRARVLRRRRAIGSGLAVVLLFTLALGAAVTLRADWQSNSSRGVAADRWQFAPIPWVSASMTPAVRPSASQPSQKVAHTSPLPQLSPIGTDVWAGRELWSTAGRFALSGVGKVTRVYRVPLGWIYGGADQARLLRTDGSSVDLGRVGSRWVVSPDGSRLAYVQDERLAVYSIETEGLASGVTTMVPAQTQPVTFAGERVVVATSGVGPFSVLMPGETRTPQWNSAVVTIYGPTANGLAGLVRSGNRKDQLCLAELTVGQQGLVVASSGACQPTKVFQETDPDGITVLSPDGDWLAQPRVDAMIYTRLETLLTGDEPVSRSCPAVDGQPQAAVWTDSTTLVLNDVRGNLAVCRVNGVAQSVPVPEAWKGKDWALVPRFMPAETG